MSHMQKRVVLREQTHLPACTQRSQVTFLTASTQAEKHKMPCPSLFIKLPCICCAVQCSAVLMLFNFCAVGERTTYFVGPVPKELPKEVTEQGTLTGSLQLGLLQGSKEHAPASLHLFFK